MRQTVNKGIGKPLGNSTSFIVEGLMLHIENRLFYVTYLMTQQVDSYHGEGVAIMTFADNVGWVLILNAQILTETKRFCLKPSFLELHQYELLRTIFFQNGGTKVYTKY